MRTPTEITEHISSLLQMVEDGELEIAILRVGETDIVMRPRSEMDARSGADIGESLPVL